MNPSSRQIAIFLFGLCAIMGTAASATSSAVPPGDEAQLGQVDDSGKPAITSELKLVLEFGKPFEYTISATNDPLGYTVRPMPVWMKRKGSVLYGNAVESGEFKIELRALNLNGMGPGEELTVIVLEKSPTACIEADSTLVKDKFIKEHVSAQTNENQ